MQSGYDQQDQERLSEKEMLRVLKKCTEANALTVYQQTMDTNAIISYLNAHPTVTKVFFEYVNSREAFVATVVSMMQSCPNLKRIHIDNFQGMISYKEAIAINQAAKNKDNEFSVYYDPWYYTEIYTADDLIKHNKARDANTLDFSADRLSISNDDMIEVIIPYLEKHPNITMLDLSDNRGIEKGVIVLAQAKTGITHLNLNCCNIADPDVFQSLCSGAYIDLCLDGNHVTDADLARIVEKNPQLKVLSVRYIDGEDREMQHYPNTIKSIATSAIEELDFSRHLICDRDIEFISKSNTIKKLDISHSEITDSSVRCLSANAINEVITDLDLSENEYVTDDALYEMITKNSTLLKINLEFIKHIGDKTAFALARHHTLQEIKVFQREDCKTITHAGVKALYAKYDNAGLNISDDKAIHAMINEDDPHKRTYLPEVEVVKLGADPYHVKDIYSTVPTLFRLAAYKAQSHYLNLLHVNKEYKLCLMSEKFYNSFCDYRIDRKSLKFEDKTIYLAPKLHSLEEFIFAMIGLDKEIKVTSLYPYQLPDWFPKTPQEVMVQQDQCMPVILKHLHGKGIINITEGANIPEAVRDVILKKKV